MITRRPKLLIFVLGLWCIYISAVCSSTVFGLRVQQWLSPYSQDGGSCFLNLAEIYLYDFSNELLTPFSYYMPHTLSNWYGSQCIDKHSDTYCHTDGNCTQSFIEVYTTEAFQTVIIQNRVDCCQIRSQGAAMTYFSYPSSDPATRTTLGTGTLLGVEANYTFSFFPTSQPSGKPTRQPTTQPSRQPSSQPSGQPISQPSAHPSTQPSAQPSRQPSVQPSGRPSSQPTKQPSVQPSRQPSSQPSGQPISQPSAHPSTQPSAQPSRQPSVQPSGRPSSQPTKQPSVQPSRQPTSRPSRQPSAEPSRRPSSQPSRQPTSQPSKQPSNQPSGQPSRQPTVQPSGRPSFQPTDQPSSQPSRQPASQPSCQPTSQPTAPPSRHPSSQPSKQPSAQPSKQPSTQPSTQPISQPSRRPFAQPTAQPTQPPTLLPTSLPTRQPTRQPSSQPTNHPTRLPSARPTSQPTSYPSTQPSYLPSRQPTSSPSDQPSMQPTRQPSCQPSGRPTGHPSDQPSHCPSGQPTGQPTSRPSQPPIGQPTSLPSSSPSNQPTLPPSTQPTLLPSTRPSTQPSQQPTQQPMTEPSAQPSLEPSGDPTTQPTAAPTAHPVALPSACPSRSPTRQPTGLPTSQPTAVPSFAPLGHPSAQPSHQPTTLPSARPSARPSCLPSRQPTVQPSTQPTRQPSSSPTSQPSAVPSSASPSALPTIQPSRQPTAAPSQQPSSTPTTVPTAQPTTHPSEQPVAVPSTAPTSQPSRQPSQQPTSQPTAQPSIANPLVRLGRSNSTTSILQAVDKLLQSLTPTLLQQLTVSQGLNTTTLVKQLVYLSTYANASVSVVFVKQTNGTSVVQLLQSGTTVVSLVLTSSSTSSNAAGVLAAVTVIDSSLYTNQTTSFYRNYSSSGSVSTPTLNSDVVTVTVSTVSKNGTTSASTLPSFDVTLQLTDTSYATTTSTTLVVNCTEGAISSGSLHCTSSHVWLNITCTGYATSSIKRSCPVSRTVCSVVTVQSGASVVSEDYCSATVSSSGTVTCSCGYSTSTSNSTVAAVAALNGKITVAAFSSFVAGDLDASVSVIATPLTGNVAAKSALVFVTFGCLWATVVVLLAAMVYRWPEAVMPHGLRRRWKVQKLPDAPLTVWTAVGLPIDGPRTPHRRWGSDEERAIVHHGGSSDQRDGVVQRTWQYVVSVVPPAFHPSRHWSRCVLSALIARHTLFRIVDQALALGHVTSLKIGVSERRTQLFRVILDVVYFVTSLTMSCFVLAVLYDLQYPVDDGYCASQEASQATCLYRKSLFDPWRSRCVWSPSLTTDDGSSDVVAVVTEWQYGQLLVTADVTPIAANDDNTSSPCQLNNSADSTVAFVFSFLITSIFSSLLEVVLDVIFRVLGDATSTDYDTDAAVKPSPSLPTPVALPQEASTTQLRTQRYSLPETVLAARYRWLASLVSPTVGHSGVTVNVMSQETTLGIFCVQRGLTAVFVQTMQALDVGVATSKRMRVVLQRCLQRWCEIPPPQRCHPPASPPSVLADAETVGRTVIKSLRRRWSRVVQWWEDHLPSLMVALLLVMHAGAMYYLVSKAAVRGHIWQRSFFKAVVWEWGTDVSVVQTVEVYVMDVLLPRWVLGPCRVEWLRRLRHLANTFSVSPPILTQEGYSYGHVPHGEATLGLGDSDEALHEAIQLIRDTRPALPELSFEYHAASSRDDGLVGIAEALDDNAGVFGDATIDAGRRAMTRGQWQVTLWLLATVGWEHMIFVTNLLTSGVLGLVVLLWYTYLLPHWSGLQWVLWALVALPGAVVLVWWLDEQQRVRRMRQPSDVPAHHQETSKSATVLAVRRLDAVAPEPLAQEKSSLLSTNGAVVANGGGQLMIGSVALGSSIESQRSGDVWRVLRGNSGDDVSEAAQPAPSRVPPATTTAATPSHYSSRFSQSSRSSSFSQFDLSLSRSGTETSLPLPSFSISTGSGSLSRPMSPSPTQSSSPSAPLTAL